MTYTDKVKELKEERKYWLECKQGAINLGYSTELSRLRLRENLRKIVAIKAKIEAGCRKQIHYRGHKRMLLYTCGMISQIRMQKWLCPDCQAAIKELKEMLK